jgi:hypothetical protein
MNQAVPLIKEALQSRLLFLGQYDLAPGPPIHKSATCIVRKAFDEKAEVEYRELFKKYSAGAAPISKDTFKETVKQLGMTLTDKFDEKFASWDVDKSGAITCDEFIKFCALELDQGQKREVVFKFMKNEDQFKRELEARNNNDLDPRFIVGVTKSFKDDEDDDFRAAVASIKELAEYKCVRASEASAKEFLQ